MRKISIALVSAISIFPMVASAQVGKFTAQEICKAGIGTVMGRDVKGMKSNTSNDEVLVSYARPSDKKKFEYKCVLPPNAGIIIWATKIDGRWGRWRDTPADGKLTYKLRGENLEVDDTMGATNLYKKKDF